MSLGALIYEMEANHLQLRGRVLEEFNTRGARKAPKNSEGTQFVETSSSRPRLQGVGRVCQAPFPSLYSSSFQWVLRFPPRDTHCQPTAHWSINND